LHEVGHADETRKRAFSVEAHKAAIYSFVEYSEMITPGMLAGVLDSELHAWDYALARVRDMGLREEVLDRIFACLADECHLGSWVRNMLGGRAATAARNADLDPSEFRQSIIDTYDRWVAGKGLGRYAPIITSCGNSSIP
jgi:hypothetical protein